MKDKILTYGKRFFCSISVIILIIIVTIKYISYQNSEKDRLLYIKGFVEECSKGLYSLNHDYEDNSNIYVQANMILRDFKIRDKYLIYATNKCVNKYQKDY